MKSCKLLLAKEKVNCINLQDLPVSVDIGTNMPRQATIVWANISEVKLRSLGILEVFDKGIHC